MLSAEAFLVENSTEEVKNKLIVQKSNYGYSGDEFKKLNHRAEKFSEEDEKEIDKL
jgi:hypothetical protein